MGAGGSIDPGFRQILIAGTGAQSLAFYQFASEYCRAGPQTEITNSANVALYGLKMGTAGFSICWGAQSSRR